MTWLTVISTVLGIIASVISYLKEKKLVDAAIAEVVANNLKASLDEIQRANKVRDAVRADLAANPDKLRAPSADSRD
jgi:Zn-dependent protease with chaperone function